MSETKAFTEMWELQEKLRRGVDILGQTKAADIQVGVSAKEQVWRDDDVVLYRFTPRVKKPFPIPILIVYALVNRPYIADLDEKRSLVRRLLDLGLDVYLVDWGYPGRADRWTTLDDYINGYVDECVDEVRKLSGQDSVNLLGICQGGTFSLCYTAMHPEKIKNLITMVTPVDFHSDEGLLNRWSRCANYDLVVDAFGNLPGEFLNFAFLMLKPLQLNIGKYVDLLDTLDDEERLVSFLRMEKWIFDSPDQAGEAYREFMRDFYVGNKLVGGDLKVGDTPVRLSNITMPVLNIYAEQDHLVPPSSSLALEQHVGTDDYTAKPFPVGHIGMYVSSKVQKELPPTIADWITARR